MSGWTPDSTSGKGPQFALIPHDLVEDPRIRAGAIALYTVLKRWADFGKGSEEEYVGGSHPGSPRLADTLQMSRPTVRKLRDELEEAGWLSYLPRNGNSHLYFLHHEPLTEKERRLWEKETLALGQAFRDGGTQALFELLEEQAKSVDNSD